MKRQFNKVKSEAGDYKYAMAFEDIGDGGELHRDRDAKGSILARGRAAVELFLLEGM